MRNRSYLRGGALLAGGLMIAASCGGDDSGASRGEPATSSADGGTTTSFEQLVERARDEGSVVYYSGESAQAMEAYANGFKAAYGIDVVTQSLPQGPMQERLAQEFQTGNIQADVGNGTLDPAWNAQMAEEGHLAPLTEAEIPNLAALPAEHRGEHWLINRLIPLGVFYNTDLVEESELPATIAELAEKAEWKGRMAIVSPEIGGSIHEWHYRLIKELGQPRYEAFIDEFVGELDTTVAATPAPLVSQVAAGELVALVGITSSVTVPTINAGAPAAIYYPEPVNVSRQSLQVIAGGPHPNAARLFVHWMLSEEGAAASCGSGVCAPPHLDLEGAVEIPEGAGYVDGAEARKQGDEYINGVVAAAANA